MGLGIKVNLEKSIIDLALATGTLLDELDIDFMAPDPERPVSYVKSVWPLWSGKED